MNIELRVATLEDAELAYRLRDSDKDEIYHSGYDDIFEGFSQSILQSDHAWAVLDNGVVEGMTGVTEMADGSGVLWAMSSKELISRPERFTYAADLFFEKLVNFNHLHNYVCSSNIVHIRWLQKMGFTIEFDNFVVPRDVPFFYFTRG